MAFCLLPGGVQCRPGLSNTRKSDAVCVCVCVIPVYPQLLLLRLADSLVLGSHRVLEGLPQTGEWTCVTVWLLFDCRSVQTIDIFHHFLIQSKHRDGSTMDGSVSVFSASPSPTHPPTPRTLHVLSLTGFTLKWFYVSFNQESRMLSSPLSG